MTDPLREVRVATLVDVVGRRATWRLVLRCGHRLERATSAEGDTVRRPPRRCRCVECAPLLDQGAALVEGDPCPAR